MDKKKLDSLVFVEAISLTIVKRNQVLAARFCPVVLLNFRAQ
jgi:hypothetical protein